MDCLEHVLGAPLPVRGAGDALEELCRFVEEERAFFAMLPEHLVSIIRAVLVEPDGTVSGERLPLLADILDIWESWEPSEDEYEEYLHMYTHEFSELASVHGVPRLSWDDYYILSGEFAVYYYVNAVLDALLGARESIAFPRSLARYAVLYQLAERVYAGGGVLVVSTASGEYALIRGTRIVHPVTADCDSAVCIERALAGATRDAALIAAKYARIVSAERAVRERGASVSVVVPV